MKISKALKNKLYNACNTGTCEDILDVVNSSSEPTGIRSWPMVANIIHAFLMEKFTRKELGNIIITEEEITTVDWPEHMFAASYQHVVKYILAVELATSKLEPHTMDTYKTYIYPNETIRMVVGSNQLAVAYDEFREYIYELPEDLSKEFKEEFVKYLHHLERLMISVGPKYHGSKLDSIYLNASHVSDDWLGVDLVPWVENLILNGTMLDCTEFFKMLEETHYAKD